MATSAGLAGFLQDPTLRFLILLILLFGLIILVLAVLSLWLRLRRDGVRREWSALELRWDTYLMEALADSALPIEVYRHVETRHTAWFLDHLARYAVLLRGKRRDLLSALAQPFLGWAIARLSHPDAVVRAHAASHIGILGSPEDQSHLYALLDDPSPLVSMVCVRFFLQSHHLSDLKSVMVRLERFSEWNRYTLVVILSAAGPDLAPLLRPLLADFRRPPWIRIVAAEALAALKDHEAAVVARAVWWEATPPDLMASVLRLLGQTGNADDLLLVRDDITQPHALIRAAGLDALSRLGSSEDLPKFQSALNDPSPWVVFHAVQGLKRQGGLDLLRQIAVSDHAAQPFAQQLLQEGGEG